MLATATHHERQYVVAELLRTLKGMPPGPAPRCLRKCEGITHKLLHARIKRPVLVDGRGGCGEEYREAYARNQREYSETAEAMAERKELAPEEAADLGRLWRKLVELFHPDRFASDPVQQATYEKLTAAINHAKDNGDLVTLRKIAEDPQGFI